jgi:hypothetical protein
MENSSSKPLFLNLLLSVFSLVLVIGGLELFARLSYDQDSMPEFTNNRAHRESRPLPYKDSEYFSKEFVAKMFRQPGGWMTPGGTRLVIPGDYQGKYYNVKDGIRLTCCVPADYQNIIYLFGGSTIYNTEVPDDYTVASHLQKIINEKNLPYRVKNYGTTSVSVSQQTELLKTLSLVDGDVVAFYDGHNDILQSIYYNNPGGWIVGENREVLYKAPWVTKIKLKIFEALHEHSNFVTLFLNPYNYNLTPLHINDPEQVAVLTEEMKDIYFNGILEAKDFSEKGGAKFFHFLQPNIFTQASLTEYEKDLIANPHLVSVGLDLVFDIGYKKLKSEYPELQKIVTAYDLTSIFDKRDGDEEYFLDSCHVTDKANFQIAKAIFAKIQDEL